MKRSGLWADCRVNGAESYYKKLHAVMHGEFILVVPTTALELLVALFNIQMLK